MVGWERVQAMKQHNGHMFGGTKAAVDLSAQVEEYGRRDPHNPYMELMLQY